MRTVNLAILLLSTIGCDYSPQSWTSKQSLHEVRVNPQLDMVSDTLYLTVGVPMIPENPADGVFSPGNGAEHRSCMVSPNLPPGLGIDSLTCIISGTPTEPSALAIYTVTLTNTHGNSTDDRIGIIVSQLPPPIDPKPFQLAFDFTSPNGYVCDGPEPCAGSDTITIGNNQATLQTIDLRIDTAQEWNSQGAILEGVTAAGDSLALTSNTNLIWTLDSSWTPHWDRLVVYYDFEGDSGNARNRKNPGTLDGIWHGDAARTTSQARAGRQSAAFDGDSDYLDTRYRINTGESGELTLMAWVRLEPSTSAKTFWSAHDGNQWYEVGFDHQNTQPLHAVTRFTGPGESYDTQATNLDDGTWHHVAMTFRPTGGGRGTGRLYLNGKLEAVQDNTIQGFTTWNSNRSIWIGAYNENGQPTRSVNGHLDEFAIWEKELTAVEISLIFQKQRVAFSGRYTSKPINIGSGGSGLKSIAWGSKLPFGKQLPEKTVREMSTVYADIANAAGATGQNSDLGQGLMAYYNFDNDVASGILDSSGNGLNSNLIRGTLSSGETGVIGKAYRFGDGVARFGDIADNGALTVSVWVLPENRFATNVHSIINEGSDDEWGLHYWGPTRSVRFSFYDATAWQRGELTSPIPENQWTHVVAMYDSTFTGDQYRIYLNGNLDVSSSALNNRRIRNNLNETLDIGGWGHDISRKFEGLIDEVGIWNRGLSPDEVSQLYRRGANTIQAQVRVCGDQTCSQSPNWLGPGGFSPFYSDWHNNSRIVGGNPAGDVLPSHPFHVLSRFGITPVSGPYWQVKVVVESLHSTPGCNGQRCNPVVDYVSLFERAGNVATGQEIGWYPDAYFANAELVPYATIQSITIVDSGPCFYQLSPDGGQTFLYNNNGTWEPAMSRSQNHAASDQVLDNLSDFPRGAGLIIKALMGQDGLNCTIQQVLIEGMRD